MLSDIGIEIAEKPSIAGTKIGISSLRSARLPAGIVGSCLWD